MFTYINLQSNFLKLSVSCFKALIKWQKCHLWLNQFREQQHIVLLKRLTLTHSPWTMTAVVNLDL